MVTLLPKVTPLITPKEIVLPELSAAEAIGDLTVFHAGTTEKDGHLVTAGGRVLGVTARDNSVAAAIERVYQRVSKSAGVVCSTVLISAKSFKPRLTQSLVR